MNKFSHWNFKLPFLFYLKITCLFCNVFTPVGSQNKLIANDFGEAGLGVEQEFVV